MAIRSSNRELYICRRVTFCNFKNTLFDLTLKTVTYWQEWSSVIKIIAGQKEESELTIDWFLQTERIAEETNQLQDSCAVKFMIFMT